MTDLENKENAITSQTRDGKITLSKTEGRLAVYKSQLKDALAEIEERYPGTKDAPQQAEAIFEKKAELFEGFVDPEKWNRYVQVDKPEQLPEASGQETWRDKYLPKGEYTDRNNFHVELGNRGIARSDGVIGIKRKDGTQISIDAASDFRESDKDRSGDGVDALGESVGRSAFIR